MVDDVDLANRWVAPEIMPDDDAYGALAYLEGMATCSVLSRAFHTNVPSRFRLCKCDWIVKQYAGIGTIIASSRRCCVPTQKR